MEQCKIKPWNIRKLHFAIDQLQGAGKRRDRKEMHRELDVMTHLLCESHKMTLSDYGQASGAPISGSGLNMAVFTVKKGMFPQEIEMQGNFFPCRLVEGERGDCLVCVVASAEIAKALAAKLEVESYIFMERAGVCAPEFSQYSNTTDDTGYYYLVQVNSSLPLQEPSAVFDAIAQIDALVDGLDEKTRKMLSEENVDEFQKFRKHLFNSGCIHYHFIIDIGKLFDSERNRHLGIHKGRKPVHNASLFHFDCPDFNDSIIYRGKSRCLNIKYYKGILQRLALFTTDYSL